MRSKEFIGLLLISVLTFLPFLGLTDFHTKGEPREAIVAYSMLETGNWILPQNNGGDIAYKPPFFHWLIAGFSALNGAVTFRVSGSGVKKYDIYFNDQFHASQSVDFNS